jgi:hypothetical protein
MYRINDHTYIDTDLIPCYAYQLFIDEMRQQGKYFQPDHWTSYLFPEDQAEAPIFGVRAADAIAFCDWLTQREAGGWTYRIPTWEEANAYPIKPLSAIPSGYWFHHPSGPPEIFWITHTASNSINIPLDRDLDLDSDLDFALALALDRNPARSLDFAHALDRARNLDCALDRARNLVRDLDLARARDFYLDLDRARNLDLSLARDLARARDLALVRAHTLVRALDLALNLLLLQLRIAGDYPAFEGIRIVKERK